jgi:DNA-binding MarR family transcriptional regulator
MNETALPSRLVRAVQTARKRRAALFEGDLFSDPAWDILLELYALHLDQQRASVSGLYAASGVPPTTALRWIAKLENDGLLVRTGDSVDARRSWIKLTEDGVERMRRFFEMMPLAAISV